MRKVIISNSFRRQKSNSCLFQVRKFFTITETLKKIELNVVFLKKIKQQKSDHLNLRQYQLSAEIYIFMSSNISCICYVVLYRYSVYRWYGLVCSMYEYLYKYMLVVYQADTGNQVAVNTECNYSRTVDQSYLQV